MNVVAEVPVLQNLHQKTIRQFLIVGFTLVILLLLAGAAVAFRSANEIHNDAEHLLSTLQHMRGAGSEEAIRLDTDIDKHSKEIWFATAISGVCLILAVGCAVFTIHLTDRTIKQIEEQSNQLARVSWQMLQGQEAAARRFSHELHDELGQCLTALKANLAAMTSVTLGPKRADCLQLVDEAIRNVREISQLLRPVILDDFGLDAGLRWLCERFGERTAMTIHYRSNFEGRLRDETETHLFRIAQEALTNVARHSGASTVWLRLDANEARIRLSVEDDGRGMVPGNGPGIGLIGMKARAKQVGGEFAVDSQRDSGFAVRVSVPFTATVKDAEKDAHPVG